MIPPTVTRPVVAVSRYWRAGRYPWQLVVAVVCWVVVAVSLLTSRIGAPEPTDAATAADALNAGAGTVVAPTAQDNWFVPVLPWFGVLVLLLAVALLLGQGWARIVLAAAGLVAVVGLATAAQWQVFPALVGFLAGSVFGVLLPTHRYLQRPRDDGAPAESSTERTVVP
ncbi:hypothetical protein [Actinomycetospora sp. TBRC 11914]|uniref:hypothetical protein n=1 Tax=Actinomycetospora sp. TBRC 11914 TaxID=2729387 RepID=UPI00145C603F|nr:hypothetical protein [Actinomycetospora sp. TBRC 11914]NMO92279.1 hypothetical protein [Actinomycetospora sp. TBRC 11914]